jgi:subtilisin family serine protease
MPRGRRNLFVVLLAAFALAPPTAAAQLRTTDANVIPGQYIVVYKASAESVRTETNARERELGFEAETRFRHALKGFSTTLTRGQVRDLRRDPEVAYVAPDRRVQASSLVPATPGEHVPTGPRRLAAATSTSVEHASGVGVAVLDSGVDLQHPDLDVSHGMNCVNPGLTADDDEGHGTHVAGTIAARNNGSGVTGVAPGTKLWAVKVLDSTGSGSFSSIACGLDWVAANAAALNIKVVNMSLGGTGDPVASCGTTADPLHQAICRVIVADVLVVAAAGNDGWDFDFAAGPDVPAAYPEVLAVTAMSDSDGQAGGIGGPPSCEATEGDDVAATFSNFAGTAAGAAHTIAAPGVCITSTWPTDKASPPYATASGTSMAAPHMAGVAALCENHAGHTGTCAGKTPAQVISELRSRASAFTVANPSFGFDYDPAHSPLTGIYFGWLIRVFDTAPPETTISSAPPAATRATDASFEFAGTEAGSRFDCSLDAGAWTPCTSPQRTPTLTEGSHSLSVRAVDAAGNFDLSPAMHVWTIDTTAPDTSIASGPGRRTTSRSASFEFSASEPEARLACKLDKGEWRNCSPPKRVTRLAVGTHTLSVAAFDAVGNVDPTPATRVWNVMPTTKRIKSALGSEVSALAQRLHRFGIAALVKRGAFKARGIDTLVGGKLSLAMSGAPQGRAGVARTTVLAKGSRSVARAGRYTMKLKLTRQGKRLLRGDRRATVTLRVTFRDSFGRVIKTAKSLGLRR